MSLVYVIDINNNIIEDQNNNYLEPQPVQNPPNPRPPPVRPHGRRIVRSGRITKNTRRRR